jgi:nucleotide-binding universal stress UspA family protein
MLACDPSPPSEQQRTILIALDDSAISHYAMLYALEHVLKSPDTDLVLLVHQLPIQLSATAANVVETEHENIRSLDSGKKDCPLPCTAYDAELLEYYRIRAHGLLQFHANLLSSAGYKVNASVLGLPERWEVMPEMKAWMTVDRISGSGIGRQLCRIALEWNADVLVLGRYGSGTDIDRYNYTYITIKEIHSKVFQMPD